MLKVGDKVKIKVPDDLEINLPDAMLALNGKKMRIMKKKFLGCRKNYGPYFILDKAVSEAGVAYVFLPQWLEKVDR